MGVNNKMPIEVGESKLKSIFALLFVYMIIAFIMIFPYLFFLGIELEVLLQLSIVYWCIIPILCYVYARALD